VSDAALLEHRPLVRRGKVRDVYEDGDRLLLVASDRVSTYDVVHPTPVPGKGMVLTGLSVFWFDRTAAVCPNHLESFTDVPPPVRGRALSVRRLDLVPLECVVRGHLAGSGWREYAASGAVGGIPLPDGLRESERLPAPIFTPATKAEDGEHDVNVDLGQAAEIVGDRALVEEVRRLSLALFALGSDHLAARGLILADTKFEFGLDPRGGGPVLADEALTPDSSRIWPAERWRPGEAPPSYDKQFVRDWATGSGWDRTPPAPALPPEIVDGTARRYREAYERIADEPLAAWLARSGAPTGPGESAEGLR